MPKRVVPNGFMQNFIPLVRDAFFISYLKQSATEVLSIK